MNNDRLAFDRASVRTTDQDGRLHVAVTNISKAIVNPYLGEEIPDAESLGLDPQKIYHLLRDPEELAKAAPTFNNVPLLLIHKPSTADDHPRSVTVGTTGSEASFDAPYLRNSLTVWDAEGIEAIESKKQQELSCGYRYTADMTPGTYEGTPYDGVMRSIYGNHVALVVAGRAGPDVVVGDSLPLEIQTMSIKKPLSRKAALAKGALIALKPKLAADAKLDLNPILAGVTAANWLVSKPLIASAIKPKLAKDADLESVMQLLDSLDGGDDDDLDVGLDDEPTDMPAVDASPVDDICSMLKGKISDEDMSAIESKLRGLKLAGDEEDVPPAAKPEEKPAEKPAMDNPPPTPGTNAPGGKPATEKDASVSKPAMDAAINTAVKAAEAATIKRLNDISDAKEVAHAYVGKLSVAFDSAESVYRTALETLGVKVDGIHPSAFRAVLEAQPKPGATLPRIAQDSAIPVDFASAFPNAGRLN
ncbi:DUF2213 domain-containing protein [Paraburkholderia fungorum]|uniref:DUF2213 domain-containing protein n=1 Tax=Paraburkholderia fungorum TaxID=134537 RepID=UPI0038BDA3BC